MPNPAEWPATAPNLGLAYLAPAQAQKHVTVNEALRLLDALVQLAVADRDRGLPPPDPVLGQRHIVGAAAAGDWAGQAGRIALWEPPAGWVFLAPKPGWRAWVMAEAASAVWDGAAWAGPESLALRAARLGIGTPADDPNRLAVASSSVLFTHIGAGARVIVNKAAPAETASLLFQTGWSGRAEIGTAGSDDFALRLSGDGAAWTTALSAQAGSGRVFFPIGLRAGFGSAAVPALAFDGDADTGLFRAGADALGLAAGGAERARLTTAGLQVTGLLSGTAVTQTPADATAGRLLKVGDSATLMAASPALRVTYGGTADALALTSGAGLADPPPAGLMVRFRADAANTAAATIALDGGAAHEARTITDAALPAGYIRTAAETVAVFDGSLWLLDRAPERGANANGEFVRLSDGTQICTHIGPAVDTTAALGQIFNHANLLNWTFPAAFSAAPVVTGQGGSTARWLAPATPATTSVAYRVLGAFNDTATHAPRLVAAGRWF
jgi:hypothetical protein